jgi:hypothetical protein
MTANLSLTTNGKERCHMIIARLHNEQDTIIDNTSLRHKVTPKANPST